MVAVSRDKPNCMSRITGQSSRYAKEIAINKGTIKLPKSTMTSTVTTSNRNKVTALGSENFRLYHC